MINKDLKKRILDISYKYHLSHIGSCLTAVDIIDEIYKTKKKEEVFILSSGHAGLALYTVIEKYTGKNAEEIFNHHGVHPDRCASCHLYCSSGSLGHGIAISVGVAIADRTKNAYCLISDGELAEGSVSEAMNIMWMECLWNLKVYVNWNGYGAYRKIQINPLLGYRDLDNVHIFNTNMNDYPQFLQGQQAHYITMDEEKYKEALSSLDI